MVDWCRAKVSHLIEKLREHPILWDVRCTDEKNKNRKAEALEEIANALHVPVEEVMKKLHSLKVQFSREYCRVRREKQRTGRTYIPKWYGYEQLLFLKDANTRHKKWFVTEENDDCNDCTNSDDLSIISPTSIKDEYMAPLEEEKERTQTQTPRPIFDPSLENNTHNLQAHFLSQKFQAPQNAVFDEFISYGLYIASKLRAFNDPYLQAVAKQNINKVIFNIELKQCQRNATSKCSTSFENNFQNHTGSSSPR